MKFRKGNVVDVIWFIALLSVFIVLARSQMEFSNIATIDSYVKNIVNTEASRFVSSIAGFSKNASTCNMYNSSGEIRDLGSPSDRTSESNQDSATAYAMVNLAKDKMVESIKKEFESNVNLNTRTKGINASNITVDMKDKTGKSTIVTITLKYTVVGSNYEGKTGGLFQISKMEIPRKVVVTRVIENPLRFKPTTV